MLQTHQRRQIVPLCTVSFESFTITFHNNGTLFAVVFTDNDECRLAFDCIQRQTDKHFNKLLRRTKMTPEEARAKTVRLEDDPDTAINFGNEPERIDRYLNHTLPYFNLPAPFKKLNIEQTVPLTDPFPPEIDIPDPRQNQRSTMAISTPVVPIDFLQTLSNPATSPLVSPRANPPSKIHPSRTTISERRTPRSLGASAIPQPASPGLQKSSKTIFNIPLSPRKKSD